MIYLNSEESRQSATQMLMKLFELWKISYKDQLMLIGENEKNQQILNDYRKDGAAIAYGTDTLDRINMLFQIHALLRNIFPENEEYAYGWMSAKIVAFNNDTPIDIVRKHHLIGLNMLVQHLTKIRKI